MAIFEHEDSPHGEAVEALVMMQGVGDRASLFDATLTRCDILLHRPIVWRAT